MDSDKCIKATSLIHRVVVVVVVVVVSTLFNKSQSFVVTNRTGMNFGTIVLQVNTHLLTESGLEYDVILSRWRP